MSFSFSFSSIAVVTSICLTIPLGLTMGGPTEMLWSWLFSSVFNIMTAAVLAEMCSVYPAVGSIYYWSSAFSPSQNWAPVFSYITGCFYLLGCIAQDASLSSGMAQSLAALFSLASNGTVQIPVTTSVVITIVMLLMWTMKNLMSLQNQGIFENILTLLQIASIILISGVIILFSHQLSDKSFVFNQYVNETGF